MFKRSLSKSKLELHASVFAEQLKQKPGVKNVRQQGTILAFDLDADGQTSSYFNNIRDLAYHFLLEKGVLMRPLGNVLYILPPYCITEDELNTVYAAIEKLLHHLTE